jgi:hypothetical protein
MHRFAPHAGVVRRFARLEASPGEEKRERGLITKKPRIVVRGSPAFLTDRARGKWAAGCLPNAAGVSWFLKRSQHDALDALITVNRRCPIETALPGWGGRYSELK